MSYDPKCEELARVFLPEGASARLVENLAQALQDAAEDWMENERLRIVREIFPAGAKS